MKNKNIILFIVFTLLSFNQKAAICTSLGNGDWTNAANWSCGAVPTCGDSVVIAAGTTVTITSQQDYVGICGLNGPPIKIAIQGILKFENGQKIKLPCNSTVYVYDGGSIQPGTGGGNSNNIEICNVVVWKASDGPVAGPGCFPPSDPKCAVFLPVELLSFSGEAKDGYVDLAWSTATEKNNCCFEIERSLDAASFEKTSLVNSKAINGNSQSILNYSATDNSPLGNISYYRLKQIDKDKTFSYSNIISINYIKAKNVKFVIYPNPNKGEFTADISGIENNHEIIISLKDEKGNLVYNSNFFINDSGKLQIIPENKLASGVYVCVLTLEGIQYHVKVVVS